MFGIGKRNIWILYIAQFFDAFIIAYVIERLFWIERGMSVKMVVLNEMVYAATILLLEVPSGIAADMWGRKRLLALAAFLSTFEFAILYFAHDFWMFAMSTFFAGISHAAGSGSLEAMIYDSLKVQRKEAAFEGVYGRLKAVDVVGSSLAALGGGVFARYYGLAANYLVSLGCKAVVFVLFLFLIEPPIRKEPTSKKWGIGSRETIHLIEHIRKGKGFFKNHTIEFHYCLMGMVLSSCLIYLDEFWQLLMEEVNVPMVFFGLVSIGFLVVRLPGSICALRVKDKIPYRVFFTYIPFLYALCFFAIALWKNIGLLFPMALLGLWQGVLEPMMKGCIHHNVESDVRVTVESVLSLFMRGISVMVGLVFGIFADRNVFLGMFSLGMVALVYGIWNLWLIRKRKRT